MESWTKDLNSLKLNVKDSISIFQPISNLVEELSSVHIELLRDPENSMTPEHILSTKKDLIRSKISLHDTRYKYDTKLKSSSFYVHAVESAVGTRYENRCSDDAKIVVPRLIQSTCQYLGHI